MAVEYHSFEMTTIYGDTVKASFGRTQTSELEAKALVAAAHPDVETITLFNAKGKVNGRLHIQPKEDQE